MYAETACGSIFIYWVSVVHYTTDSLMCTPLDWAHNARELFLRVVGRTFQSSAAGFHLVEKTSVLISCTSWSGLCIPVNTLVGGNEMSAMRSHKVAVIFLRPATWTSKLPWNHQHRWPGIYLADSTRNILIMERMKRTASVNFVLDSKDSSVINTWCKCTSIIRIIWHA